MKKVLLVSFSLGAILFSSCQKEEPIRCILPSTTISVNSPAITGDNIYLTTPDYKQEPNATFEWTGPNNFYSNLQNPVITNVTSAMKGEYKLKITKGICATEEVTANLDVIVNTATCTQTDDTGTFSNIGTSYFNYFESHVDANNEYLMYGGSSQMDVYLYFKGGKPQQGSYTIVNKATALSNGTVHVKSQLANQFDYFALSGDVMITYNAYGEATVKFCSVPFVFSTNTSPDTTASVKFTITN